MNEYFEKMINEYGFEKREGQEKMAKIIQEAIENRKSCIIEAGTGIGKSLAYLLPAVLHAKKTNTKVVVSTNTINLQEQLIEKDLPLLEKILNEKIKYRLVKGRGNYICGNRLNRNCRDDNLISWYKHTKTGDKSEIDFYVDPTVWDMVKSDKDYCVGAGCARDKKCFYYKAKENIQNAEILIVNHALLFSHFKYDKVLPDFDVLILDEAHNIESIARNYFEKNIGSKEIGQNIGMIFNRRTNTGIFKKFSSVEGVYLEFTDSINGIYDAFMNLFSVIRLNLVEKNVLSMRIDKLSDKKKYVENLERIIEKFKLFEEVSKKLLLSDVEEEAKQEFTLYYTRLKEAVLFINELLNEKTVNAVDWIKLNPVTHDVEIKKTPLDISDVIKKIYEDRSVIMTSATLRIGKDFTYISNRLGLENFGKEFVTSPFDYDKNMKIFLSNNGYNPNSMEYLNYTIEFLNKYLEEKKEGTFVLCTSYKQVDTISKGLKVKGYNILIQGQLSRKKMIEEFKNTRSVLLGTDSFWEGVDVKGDKLKNIVIVKIPFFVPDDPVNEALIEDIKNKGQNPFMSFQLPQAIIKLKQGVGRLIRSKTDNGEVIILDNRVKNMRYGKVILNSLPSKTIVDMV